MKLTAKKFITQEELDVIKLMRDKKLSMTHIEFDRSWRPSANFKIGSKKAGNFYDVPSGGGYEFEYASQFTDILKEIADNAPEFYHDGIGKKIPFRVNSLVQLLMNDILDRRECKRKTVVLIKNGKNGVLDRKTFDYPYIKEEEQEFLDALIDKNCKFDTYEFLNTRFV